MNRWLLRLFGLIVVIGAVAVVANWLFVKRYVTYLWHGYDAHTAPVEWFEPTAELTGGGGSTLPLARPENRTIPDVLLDELAEYAGEQDTHALIIVRHGLIELEQYWNGATRDTLFNPQSMSKTVVGMLTGIAIDEGHINSVDDAIGQYITEWADEPRGQITVENLLQMSAGLAQISSDYRPVPWSRGVWQHFGTDFDGWALSLPLKAAPGTEFEYNNNENHLLGLVVERATGVWYPEYLSAKLWRPLDMGAARMYLDKPDGTAIKACCIFSRPIDWVKLGLLVLNKGRFGDQQLLPPGWAEAMTTPAETNPEYGYTIWLGGPGLAEIGEDKKVLPNQWWSSERYATDVIYTFVGHGFQHVWVIPDLDMVIVRGTRVWPKRPWDQSRIPNMLWRALR